MQQPHIGILHRFISIKNQSITVQFIHSLLQKKSNIWISTTKTQKGKKNSKISLTQYINRPILHATYRIKMRHRRRLGVQTWRCSREKGRVESGEWVGEWDIETDSLSGTGERERESLRLTRQSGERAAGFRCRWSLKRCRWTGEA